MEERREKIDKGEGGTNHHHEDYVAVHDVSLGRNEEVVQLYVDTMSFCTLRILVESEEPSTIPSYMSEFLPVTLLMLRPKPHSHICQIVVT